MYSPLSLDGSSCQTRETEMEERFTETANPIILLRPTVDEAEPHIGIYGCKPPLDLHFSTDDGA